MIRTFQRLIDQVNEIEPLLEKVDQHPGKQIHPILGPLSPREWLMFMAIHQNHHLSLAKDILDGGNES